MWSKRRANRKRNKRRRIAKNRANYQSFASWQIDQELKTPIIM